MTGYVPMRGDERNFCYRDLTSENDQQPLPTVSRRQISLTEITLWLYHLSWEHVCYPICNLIHDFHSHGVKVRGHDVIDFSHLYWRGSTNQIGSFVWTELIPSAEDIAENQPEQRNLKQQTQQSRDAGALNNWTIKKIWTSINLLLLLRIYYTEECNYYCWTCNTTVRLDGVNWRGDVRDSAWLRFASSEGHEDGGLELGPIIIDKLKL